MTLAVRERQVRLFLVDGSASGVVTAEIVNWTGMVIGAPRSLLPEVLARPDARKTGVYVLFGDIRELGERREVYVGESDDVGLRIQQHVQSGSKDFFERFCLIVSKDFNLTKAHARYLEARLTAIARSAERSTVLNANEPAAGILPEADISDMEFFIEQVKIVLPVLGYDLLRDRPVRQAAGEPPGPSVLNLTLRKSRDGLEARAVQSGGDFVILAGSMARKQPDYSSDPHASLRETLLREGTLVDQGTALRFARDFASTSPSAASSLIYGRNDNGRVSWLIEGSAITLKQHEAAEDAPA